MAIGMRGLKSFEDSLSVDIRQGNFQHSDVSAHCPDILQNPDNHLSAFNLVEIPSQYCNRLPKNEQIRLGLNTGVIHDLRSPVTKDWRALHCE